MDGYEVCRRLKGSEITPLIPVIMVTDLDDIDLRTLLENSLNMVKEKAMKHSAVVWLSYSLQEVWFVIEFSDY